MSTVTTTQHYVLDPSPHSTHPTRHPMEAVESGSYSMWLMYCLICITCPISVPLLALCWCCQEFSPLNPEVCLGEGQELTSFSQVEEWCHTSWYEPQPAAALVYIALYTILYTLYHHLYIYECTLVFSTTQTCSLKSSAFLTMHAWNW